ncbi:MAG TPA: hypothetical protein VMW75_06485, partial [Thermoanaerobaculia bacterium]|nr:hypothetical protein [Thermoanaerobaculia bacterium]
GAQSVPWFDVDAFLADAALLAAEIGGAIARRDGQALQGSAHRLVGSAGWFPPTRTSPPSWTAWHESATPKRSADHSALAASRTGARPRTTAGAGARRSTSSRPAVSSRI